MRYPREEEEEEEVRVIYTCWLRREFFKREGSSSSGRLFVKRYRDESVLCDARVCV